MAKTTFNNYPIKIYIMMKRQKIIINNMANTSLFFGSRAASEVVKVLYAGCLVVQ